MTEQIAEETRQTALLTETVTEVFGRLISPYEKADEWNDGLSALSISAAWMEQALLDLHGPDKKAALIVRNNFGRLRRRFEQLFDAATNWPGERI